MMNQRPSRAAVVVGQRIRRVLARRPMRHVLAEQARLHGAAIGPQAVLQQRRLHHAALPGLLPPVQRRDDRGVQAVALGWSPMPGMERAGAVSASARTMSIRPVRAQ